MRIAFDVGGVLSRYPDVFRTLIRALHETRVEVYVISDMHPREKILDMLGRNHFDIIPEDRVHSANYQTFGERCKAVLCWELGIDVLVDDFIGYVADPGKPPVRLLVMPDSSLPYYHPTWETDGSEGDFGRRNPPGSKRPPEDR